MTLDDLPAVFADDDDVPPLAFGLTDLPSSQSRAALTLDLVHGGHLYVAGSARSGRSTVLRTLAGALASSCSPSDVHLYAIDCGDCQPIQAPVRVPQKRALRATEEAVVLRHCQSSLRSVAGLGRTRKPAALRVSTPAQCRL